MPIITNLEDKILQLVRSNQYQWFTVGVNLGGVSGVEGGSGIPLGGFVGQLIQSKVTFDTSEAISLDIPASGQSLVHNLNRIRYWIDQKGSPLVVQDEGVQIASGVTTLDFVGAPVDVTFSGGKAIVTISGTGEGGGGDTVKVSSDDTTTNYLDSKVTVALPITKIVNNPAGNENLEIGFDGDLDDLSDVSIITAVSGQILAYTNTWLNLSLAGAGISAIGHTHLESDVTDLEHDAVKIQSRDVDSDAPSTGDALRWDGDSWTPSGIESGGVSTFLNLTDTPADYSGYAGYSAVVNIGEDALEFVNVSGGGGGSSYTYALEDVTGQIPAGGDNFTLAAEPASGALVLHFNGLTQQPNNYNISGAGFHTLFSPIAGDELVAEYYTDVPSENILGLTMEVQASGVSVAQNVEILNFNGMVVIDEGSGKVTVSGGTGTGGGGDISIEDEGSEITSGVTSLNFVGDSIVATNDGDDVTVTVSGIIVDPPPFIGCKTYRTSDQQLTTDNGWQYITWLAEEYDTDSMWSTGYAHNVNTTGYYNITGQVSLSGALPQTERFELGLFKNSTLIAKHWDGFYSESIGIRTLLLQTDQYFLDTDSINMQIICGTTDQPYIMLGVENSFLASHKIQGVFVEGATPEVCKVLYTGNLTVADSTDTPIPWSSETYDTGNFWDSGSSTRFTISTAGYYNLKATSLWETVYYQGVTPFTIRMAFRKNGSTKLANHWDWNDVNTGGVRSEGLSTHVATDVYLEATDYIEVVAWHEKGSSASNIIRANDTYATIQRIA